MSSMALREELADVLATSKALLADAPTAKPSSAYLEGKAVCPLVNTPSDACSEACSLASIGLSDVVLDLGCGDGRMLVEAARRGARAIGFDVRRSCLAQSRSAAERSGLSHLIEVVEHDIMCLTTHQAYARATVLYVYLIPRVIEELEPTLRRAVRDGKKVLIYCTTGCESMSDAKRRTGGEVLSSAGHGSCSYVPRSMVAGNALGGLVPARQAMLGMLRLYQRGSDAKCAGGLLSLEWASVGRSHFLFPQGPAALGEGVGADASGLGGASGGMGESAATTSEAAAAAASADEGGVRYLRFGSTDEVFEEGAAGSFHPDFASVAAGMDPILRRALVDDVVDDDDEALVAKLECHLVPHTRALLRKPGAIGPSGCAALRRAVDMERDVTRDSVDRQAQHQLNISVAALIELVGASEVERLWRVADELLALQRAEAAALAAETGVDTSETVREKTEAADGGFYVDLFVRRYTRESRPWIAFHQDVSNVTVNVALSDDAAHEGGRLHVILNGRHQTLTRGEGEATAHGDDVMHAVSAMRSGVRYTLIMFFYTLQDTPEAEDYQTIPKQQIWRPGESPGCDDPC